MVMENVLPAVRLLTTGFRCPLLSESGDRGELCNRYTQKQGRTIAAASIQMQEHDA